MDAEKPTALRRLAKVAGVTRDGWLVVGIALLLIVGMEAAYRAQAGARRALFADPTEQVRALEANAPWFDAYRAEQDRAEVLEWQPYTGWRRPPLTGEFLNVDSLGRRVTVQRAPTADAIVDVFFFGGSTMFGTFQRDEWTIPSVTARLLQDAGRDDVRVTNFGETGYAFTQEVIELLLQLRAGARPRVVVFYDGINDVAALVQNGEAGLPQNVANRRRDFRLGQALFPYRRRLRDDAQVAIALGSVALERWQLLQRLLRVPAQQGRGVPIDSLPPLLTESYVATVGVVESLADAYGFSAIYIWQPTIHTTSKPLTVYERSLMDIVESPSRHSQFRRVHLAVSSTIDDSMAGVATGRFLNLTCLFSDTSEPVFGDEIGHTYEAPNTTIVSAFLPLLEDLLEPEADRGATRAPPCGVSSGRP